MRKYRYESAANGELQKLVKGNTEVENPLYYLFKGSVAQGITRAKRGINCLIFLAGGVAREVGKFFFCDIFLFT
jgi:hypothetical protein